MSPDKAGVLLDELVYERVYSCIDIKELARFANELMSALDECGVAESEVPSAARDMVIRALTRIRDEAKDFELASENPFDDDCPLCVDLAQHERAAKAKERKAAKPRVS